MSHAPSRRFRAAAALLTAGGVLAGVLTGGAVPAQAATTPATCVGAVSAGVAVKSAAGAAIGTVDVLDPLAQVLPAKHFAGASSANLCSARNASASFQLEVSADRGSAIGGLTVSASDLIGPNGAVLTGTAGGAKANVQLAREDYVTLSRLSDSELDPNGGYDTVTPAASRVSRNQTTGACTDTADACRFPDQLIPDYDAVYGTKRNAFSSVTVPAGENRTVWADVFVPTSTPAGTYTGTVTVSSSSGAKAQIPVQLQVVEATLPSTSTLHSAFFYENPTTDSTGYQQAAELGLNNRISVVPDGVVGGAGPAAIVGPLINGTDKAVRLTDANGTRAALTSFPMGVKYTTFANYKSLFTASTITKPWAYSDEDGSTAAAARYAANVSKVWPGLPMLSIDAAVPNDGTGAWPDPETAVVPSELTSSVGGVVLSQQYVKPDGWIPRGWNQNTDDRAPFLTAWAAKAAGREAWSYSSNMSGHIGDYAQQYKQNVGFASLGIDQIASEQLATGWISYVEGLKGQLYWSVNQAATESLDAAKNGLSGDGTLFYPYDSAKVGGGAGSKAVLMESIRLKRIRQGMQDYELLRLAPAASAMSIAKALFPSASRAAVAATAVSSARQNVFRLFSLPANPTTPTNPPTPAKTIDRHDLDGSGTSDFVAVQKSSGSLLFYGRTATDWAVDAPRTIGTGFGTSTATQKYQALLLPGDLTGDGRPDLLGRKADGTLVRMNGNGDGSVSSTATALATATTRPVAVGDFTGDGRPDLLDTHADGTLWLLAGTSSGTFAAATQAGAGWGSLELAGVGDFDKDGAADVIARTADGGLLLYEGTGTGGWKTVDGGIPMGLTLSRTTYPTLIGAGDLTGDGKADLVAIDSSGSMIRFTGNGSTGFTGSGVPIGSGWGAAGLLQIAA